MQRECYRKTSMNCFQGLFSRDRVGITWKQPKACPNASLKLDHERALARSGKLALKARLESTKSANLVLIWMNINNARVHQLNVWSLDLNVLYPILTSRWIACQVPYTHFNLTVTNCANSWWKHGAFISGNSRVKSVAREQKSPGTTRSSRAAQGYLLLPPPHATPKKVDTLARGSKSSPPRKKSISCGAPRHGTG